MRLHATFCLGVFCVVSASVLSSLIPQTVVCFVCAKLERGARDSKDKEAAFIGGE